MFYKSDFKFYLLLIFFLFFSFTLLCQNIYSGSIKDSLGNPISSAIIKIQNINSININSYVYSNKNGQFNIKDFDKKNSTLIISKLGYYSVSVKCDSINDSIPLIILQKKYFTLPEVKIKNNPIYIKSDTINYFVKSFEQKQDLVLGNVLKRLPGVEVTSSGQIKYQGVAINKLYIEGQDLLDNKYALATNNIPITAIDQIQILENHQPIKAIDSFSFSNQAAINIKIDKSFKKKVFGRGMISSTSFSPLSIIEIIPMNFSDYQFIGSIKFNNIGNDISVEQNSFNNETIVDDLRGFTKNIDLLNISSTQVPNIEKARYLNNNTKIFTYNSISSSNKNYQLKYNIDYLSDNQKQISSITNNYKYGEDVFTHIDNSYLKSKQENFKTGISFVSNLKNRYIKNDLIIEKSDKFSDGKFVVSGDSINQKLQNNFKNIINKFSLIKVFGTANFAFRSYSSYNNTNQDLDISNINIELPIDTVYFNRYLKQSIFLSSYYLHNYFSVSKKFKYLILESKFGNWNIFQSFNSGLYNTKIYYKTNLLDSTSIRSNNSQSNIYQSFNVSYISKAVKISLTFPLNYYFENVSIYNSNGTLKKYFRYEYSFLSRFNISNKLILFTEKSSNYLPAAPYLTSNGYFLNNYRSLINNYGFSSNYIFDNTKVNLSYKDVKKILFISFTYLNEKNTANTSVDRFFKNEFMINKLILKENISVNNKYIFTLNKYLSNLNTSFIGGISLENYYGTQYKNKMPFKFTNNLLLINAKLNSKITKFSIEYSVNYLNQRVINSPTNSIMFKNEFSLFTDIFKNSYLKMNIENYNYKNWNSNNNNNSFLDLSVFSQSINKKRNFEIGVKNLFDISSFTSYNINSNILSISEYNLRERYIYTSLNFIF